MITGLGTIVVDYLAVLPGFPKKNSKTTILEDHIQTGGPVPTALVFLQRMGHQTAFLGTWGRDHEGLLIEQDLSQEEVDWSQVQIRGQEKTGYSQIWIDHQTGERTIACFRPRNSLKPDELPLHNLKQTRLLHLDGWPSETALHAARIVKQHGGQVTLDAGTLKPGFRKLLPFLDYINCPAEFSSQYLMQYPEIQDEATMLETFLDAGVSWVTITDGANPAFLYTKQYRFSVAPPEIPVVDSNGAGDVFSGCMIHALLHEMSPGQALSSAVSAASLKCSRMGNRDGLPTWSQIEEKSSNCVINQIEISH